MICKHIIQYKSILDLLERIIDDRQQKDYKNPKIKIFTIEQIKKQPGYIKLWHKQNNKSKSRNLGHHRLINIEITRV